MLEIFGYIVGTPLQAATLVGMITAFGIWWIRGWGDRRRASNDTAIILNKEASDRFKEFRNEVHTLRNELAAMAGELHKSQNQSARRGDKLNMLLFIIRLVMDELAIRDSGNVVLAQARRLLDGIEDEPHEAGNSNVLNAAQDTVESAKEAEREVKASEAKQ